MPPAQAEAEAEALAEVFELNLKDLATKEDLLGARDSLRQEMRELELRLTIKLGSIVVIALGAFTALSKWIG